MLRILELPKQFRPKTSIKYPPFKNGRYMEEYFYDFYLEELEQHKQQPSQPNKNEIQVVYIPVFWTNIQNHPGFLKTKETLSLILTETLLDYEKNNSNKENTIKYFTIVQHDDGILLDIPKKIKDKLTIFGACTGDIPLPLIYEDTANTLDKYYYKYSPNTKKEFLASFVGSETHPVRQILTGKLRQIAESPDKLRENGEIRLQSAKTWTNSVSDSAADNFLDMTIKSRLCLAPRGYGRSSFRFFEAIQLNVIPVYIWDDIEWLPYKDFLNYEEFSISINVNQLNLLEDKLESIANTNKDIYANMLNKLSEVKPYFSLEFMGYYILHRMGITSNHHLLAPQ